jgi:hypothetical protein
MLAGRWNLILASIIALMVTGCVELLSTSAPVAIRRNMTTPNEQSKYSPEQIDEIINRIAALRMRWLRHVETELASQQSHVALNHFTDLYTPGLEPAE